MSNRKLYQYYKDDKQLTDGPITMFNASTIKACFGLCTDKVRNELDDFMADNGKLQQTWLFEGMWVMLRKIRII